MMTARNGIIPELNNNEPSERNKYGETVAMILA